MIHDKWVKAIHIVSIVLLTVCICVMSFAVVDRWLGRKYGARHKPIWSNRARTNALSAEEESRRHFIEMQRRIDELFTTAFRSFPECSPAIEPPEEDDLSPRVHLHRMQREIDRMFETAWRDMPSLATPFRMDDEWDTLHTMPAMDLKETPDAYIVSVCLPGIAKSDIRISIEGALLAISASHMSTNSTAESTRRNRWSFDRRIRLPEAPSRIEDITAMYENGLLRVTLPRAAKPPAPLAKEVSVR